MIKAVVSIILFLKLSQSIINVIKLFAFLTTHYFFDRMIKERKILNID